MKDDVKPIEHFDLGGQQMPDMSLFALTDAEFEKLEDAKMLVEKLIVSGHIFNIAAPANAGKTTIMMYLCEQMAREGITIWYINADCPPDAAKAYQQRTRDLDNFTLILPDFKGVTMDEVLGMLNRYIETDTRMDNTVIIYDTMKKVVDLMGKSGLREFYKAQRRMTALGATVGLLGHTNKHVGADGNLIFEGTGDVRNDTDELFYMSAIDNPDGSKTVTMEPDKKRAFNLDDVTFTIHPDWTVTRDDEVVDVKFMIVAKERREKDQWVIDAITGSIQDLEVKGKSPIQARITEMLKGDINHKTVERVIREQKDSIWEIEKGVNNSKIVKLL